MARSIGYSPTYHQERARGSPGAAVRHGGPQFIPAGKKAGSLIFWRILAWGSAIEEMGR